MHAGAIAVYLLTLILGTATVVAGARLARRCSDPFLSLYRSFLLVYVIYVFVFFAGSRLLLEVRPAGGPELYLTYQLMGMLAEPAWSVFVYLLALWGAALVGWTIPRAVRWGYWILQAGLYGAIFVILRSLRDAPDRRAAVARGEAVDVLLHALVYAALAILLVGAFRARGERRRNLAGRLGTAYLVGFAAATAVTFTWLPVDRNLEGYLASRACVYFLVNAAPLWILTRFLGRHRLEPLGEGADDAVAPRLLEALTVREREIVPLVADGFTNEEIGERLFISPKTVKNTISNIYRKLGVRNRVELSNRYREREPVESRRPV